MSSPAMVYAFIIKTPVNGEERVMIVSANNLDYALAGIQERMNLERTGMAYDTKLSMSSPVDEFISHLSLPVTKTEFVMPKVVSDEPEHKSDMTEEERMDAMAGYLSDHGYRVTKKKK